MNKGGKERWKKRKERRGREDGYKERKGRGNRGKKRVRAGWKRGREAGKGQRRKGMEWGRMEGKEGGIKRNEQTNRRTKKKKELLFISQGK